MRKSSYTRGKNDIQDEAELALEMMKAKTGLGVKFDWIGGDGQGIRI